MAERRGIPTTYGGVRFRSRLEARWAVFFDLLGWKWAYEPYDLAGYIPDFVLNFPHAPLVVEVKPETELAELRTYGQRIALSGWEREILIVGAQLFDASGTGPVIGALGDASDVRGGGALVLGPGRAFRCIDCGLLSLLHDDASWRCRVTGCEEGHVGSTEPGEVEGLWLEAGNRIQWRAA